MTLDDFWKKYHRCTMCEHDKYQPYDKCHYCIYKFDGYKSEDMTEDNFVGSERFMRTINREVDEF